MKLAEWATLAGDEQRKLIVQWHEDLSPTNSDYCWDYHEMANEAAQSLKNDLKSISGVAHVQVGGEIIDQAQTPFPVIMLILNVCTSLPESKKLENLPSHFAGFHVKQLAFGDNRDAFLATLKRCLKEIMGWDEAETMEWVKKWGKNTSGGENVLVDSLQGGLLSVSVYSHGPIKKALEAIIDKQTRETVKLAGNDLIKLRNDMLAVFWDAARKAGSSESDHPDKIENFDWKVVKKKIDETIKNYCLVKQQN